MSTVFLLPFSVHFSKEVVLDLPKFRGKVNVIFMRIFKTLHFLPKGIDLLRAIFSDLLNGRRFVNAFSVFKNRNEHLLCNNVGKNFFLPGCLRIENFDFLFCIGCFFVIKSDIVCNGLSVFFGIETVEGLEIRNGDFSYGFAYFNNRFKFSASFNSCKFINASENRVAFCGDKVLAYAEAVDGSALNDKIADDIFIKGV